MRPYKRTSTTKKHIIGTDPGLPQLDEDKKGYEMTSKPNAQPGTGPGLNDDVVEIDSSDYEMLEKSNIAIGGSDADNLSDALETEPRDMDDDNMGMDDDDIEEITPPTLRQPELTKRPGHPLLIPATQFDNLATSIMKPLPDYPVKDETYNVWEIKDWNAIRKEDKIRGPQFECGGFTWNILLFPKGNNDLISMYMEPHPPKDAEGNVDPKWYVCAQFGFDLWNPNHPECHHAMGSHHRFNKNETDWGFSSFISGRDLLNAAKYGRAYPLMDKKITNDITTICTKELE